MARNAITVYLPDDLLARVRAEAKSAHRSESSLVSEAIRARYQKAENGSEEEIARRFTSRLDARLEKVVGESLILKEIMLLFIQVWLKHNPALDEALEESATASAEARFERFLDHVAQGLSPGSSLGSEVLSLDAPFELTAPPEDDELAEQSA